MLLTDADFSLLDWMFQHYSSVDIHMSRDRHDMEEGILGGEQWQASTWDNTKTWRTGTGITLSDAIKSLISRINEVENKKTIWT